MDLSLAIEAHLAWKIRFREHIADRLPMDADKVTRDDVCTLGKWIHGTARQQLADYPAFINLVRIHADFHREAGRIAEAINAKQYDVAEALMGPDTAYARLSITVGRAIFTLKQDAGLS